MPSLSNNKTPTWGKDKAKSLSVSWTDPKNPGTGTVSVKLDGAAKSYSVPNPSITIDNKAGSLTNNTGKTSDYALS
ncbi:MAG TPA: hypothetical protein VE842_19285 [Pyrinomonadaceae bacterium]|jgi:hypothetical protein|nr:hypothetical protein [Pyrinomonadaceae bacterium]